MNVCNWLRELDWTEINISVFECILKTKASSDNWKRHYEDDGLIIDWDFANVNEDFVKESLNTHVSFLFSIVPQQKKKNKSNLTFFCPAAAGCSPLQSLSAGRLMPASTIRNPSDKFKIFMFLFVDWGSASSDSLWKICFRISTRHYRIHSWKWDNWKKLSAFASIKLGSSFIIVGLGSNHIKLRTIGEAKIRKILYFLFSVKIAHIVIIIFR